MREGDLYADICRGAMSQEWLLYRLTEGINKAPADLAGINPCGTGVLVEVKKIAAEKKTKGDERFPWRLFSPHQITWMQRYVGTGGISIALLYDEVARVMSAYLLNIHNFPNGTMTNISDMDVIILTLDKSSHCWLGWNIIHLLWTHKLESDTQPDTSLQ